eukprot:126092-Pelagomonas_calceolata.AAC.1
MALRHGVFCLCHHLNVDQSQLYLYTHIEQKHTNKIPEMSLLDPLNILNHIMSKLRLRSAEGICVQLCVQRFQLISSGSAVPCNCNPAKQEGKQKFQS